MFSVLIVVFLTTSVLVDDELTRKAFTIIIGNLLVLGFIWFNRDFELLDANMRSPFISSPGSAYARFRRAVGSGNLLPIRIAAAELPKVQLHDSLAILPVIAEKEPARYERAACRWLARFALEREPGLEEIGAALAALERLPDHPPARWVLADLLA